VREEILKLIYNIFTLLIQSSRGRSMKVRIDEDLCLSSRVCEDSCPDVFKVNDDTNIAEVIKTDFSEEDEKCIREAAENCPGQAIIVEE
jgi:ferredoxin